MQTFHAPATPARRSIARGGPPLRLFLLAAVLGCGATEDADSWVAKGEGQHCSVPLAIIDLEVPPELTNGGTGPYEFTARFMVGPRLLPQPCLKAGGQLAAPEGELRAVLSIDTEDALLTASAPISHAEIENGTILDISFPWDGFGPEYDGEPRTVTVSVGGFLVSNKKPQIKHRIHSVVAEAQRVVGANEPIAPPPSGEQLDAIAALADTVAGSDGSELSGHQRQQRYRLHMTAFPDVMAERHASFQRSRASVAARVSPEGFKATAEQLQVWEDLFVGSDGAIRVFWDEASPTPTAVTFSGTRERLEPEFDDDAQALVSELSGLLAMAPGELYVPRGDSTESEPGTVVVTMDRMIGGFRVSNDNVRAVYTREGSRWLVDRLSIDRSILSPDLGFALPDLIPAEAATVDALIENALAARHPDRVLAFTRLRHFDLIRIPEDGTGPHIERAVIGSSHEPGMPVKNGALTIAFSDFTSGAVSILDTEFANLDDLTVTARLTIPYATPSNSALSTIAPLPFSAICREALPSLQERFCPTLDARGTVSLSSGAPNGPVAGEPAFVFPRDWRPDRPSPLPGGILARGALLSPFGDESEDFGHRAFPMPLPGSALHSHPVLLPTPWPNEGTIQAALDLGDLGPLEDRTRTWALQAQWWASYASDVWRWSGIFPAPVRTSFGFYDKLDIVTAQAGSCGQWRGWLGLLEDEDTVNFWILDSVREMEDSPVRTYKVNNCDAQGATARTIPHEFGHRLGGFTAVGHCIFGGCNSADPIREHWADYVQASLSQMWQLANWRLETDGSDPQTVHFETSTKPNWNFRGNAFYRSVLYDQSDSFTRRQRRRGFTGMQYHGMHQIGARSHDRLARFALRQWAGVDLLAGVGSPHRESRRMANHAFDVFGNANAPELRRALYDHDWIARYTFKQAEGGFPPRTDEAPEPDIPAYVEDDFPNFPGRSIAIDSYREPTMLTIEIGGADYLDRQDSLRFYAQEGRTYLFLTRNSRGVDPMLSISRADANPTGAVRVWLNNNCLDQAGSPGQPVDIPVIGILDNAGVCDSRPSAALESAIRFSPPSGRGGWYILDAFAYGGGRGSFELVVLPSLGGSVVQRGATTLLATGDEPVAGVGPRRAAVLAPNSQNWWTIQSIRRACLVGYQVDIATVGSQTPLTSDKVAIVSDVYQGITIAPTFSPTIGTLRMRVSFDPDAVLSPSKLSGLVQVRVRHPDYPAGAPDADPFVYRISATEIHGPGCDPTDASTFGNPFVFEREHSDFWRTAYGSYSETLSGPADDDYVLIELQEGERIAISVSSPMGTLIDVDGVDSSDLHYMSPGKLASCNRYSDDYSSGFDYSSVESSAECLAASNGDGVTDEQRSACCGRVVERGYLSSAKPVLAGEGVGPNRPALNHLNLTAYANGTYRIRMRPYREEISPYRPGDGVSPITRDLFEAFPAPYQLNIAVSGARQAPRPRHPSVPPLQQAPPD